MKHLSNLHSHLVKHKTLSTIAITEAIIIVVLLIYISSLKTALTQRTQAQNGNANSELITQEVILCNKLTPPDRPVCARTVGMKIATLFTLPEERLKQCMKFFPLLVRHCQEGAFATPLETTPEPTPTL